MDNVTYQSTTVQTRNGMGAASLTIGLVSILALGLFRVGVVLGLILTARGTDPGNCQETWLTLY